MLFTIGPVSATGEDLVTVGLLVLLEAILSADNAIVLALLAFGLPREQQKTALKIGIWCAFLFRVLAVIFLLGLLRHTLSKLIALGLGGAYLLWLPIKHFRTNVAGHAVLAGDDGPGVATTTSFFGLSLFWSAVVRIEFTDVVFSVDSILVAMATSSKGWVIITGGILGIIAMRFVAGGFLKIVGRFPSIVEGAYLIVAVAGIKMLLEFAHTMKWVHYDRNRVKWVAFGLIGAIFVVSLLMGRRMSEAQASGEAGASPDRGTGAAGDGPEA